jgi:hypothetical protein
VRILAVILSIACGIAYGYWASQPVWSVAGYGSTQYLGYDDLKQTLYSFVQRDQHWWIERRHLQTGELVSKVAVMVPTSVVGKLHCVRNTHPGRRESDVTVIAESQNNAIASCFIVQMATGKCMPLKHDDAWYKSVCYGNRYVKCDNISTLIDKENRVYTVDYGISLYDEDHQTPRRLKCDTIPFSFAFVDERFLIVGLEREMQLIDWNSGEVISTQAFDAAPRYELSVSRKGRVYLSYYDSANRFYLQRYQISNSKLEACGPAWPMPESVLNSRFQLGGMHLEEDDQGNIHLACYCAETWTRPWRTIFLWLAKQGWKIGTYIPTNKLYAKYVINARDEVIDYYETPFWTGRFVLEQFQVAHQDSIIQVFKTSAIWPNAVAVAMVVYLGFYVWQHRKQNVNGHTSSPSP